MKLLLVGAGHAHLEVLRSLATRPAANASVTVVSPHPHVVYSGLVPGIVAGHFGPDAASIPLAPLASAARAALITQHVIAVDPHAREATLDDGSRVGFDIASLNVGGAGASPWVRSDNVVPVRPLERLLAAWRLARDEALHGVVRSLVVVGGGASGVELACAIEHRLRADARDRRPTLTLVTDQPALLTDHASAVGRRFMRILDERGVEVRLQARVERIEASRVLLDSGESLDADRAFVATGPAAPAWLAASGLDCDARGFVRVDDHLRSVSHACVFAAGDCATQVGQAHVKAGTYAVRQGRVLAANIARILHGGDLVTFVPPQRALALITTGGRDAVASWGRWSLRGAWLWRRKTAIDRRYVERYRLERAAIGPGRAD